MEIVRKIKKENKPYLKDMFLCSYLISQRISPYLSSMYIKKKIIPNRITIHMILSGIIGAILFSMPNIIAKIFGAVLIHLWFILDCSDGEVARYTKTFSTFGRELDYMAHLINHPLFGMGIFISLYQLDRYNPLTLFVLVLLSNLIDYGIRNITTLNILDEIKDKNKVNSNIDSENTWNLKTVVLFIASIFTLYPNFVLFGVIIYFIDLYIGTNILYIYLTLNVVVTGLFLIRHYVKKTKYYFEA